MRYFVYRYSEQPSASSIVNGCNVNLRLRNIVVCVRVSLFFCLYNKHQCVLYPIGIYNSLVMRIVVCYKINKTSISSYIGIYIGSEFILTKNFHRSLQ